MGTGEGRGTTIKNQITECGVINEWTAQVLNQRAMIGITMEEAETFFKKAEDENETLEKALALLESSTVNLIAAIRSFPVEKLDEILTMPWGETRTFMTMATKTVWNMNYHEGQINYIHHYLSKNTV